MRRCLRGAGFFAVLVLFATPGWSGSHSWEINEMFSNADGSVQYIELYNPHLANETILKTKWVKGNNNQSPFFGFDLPRDSTTNTYLLLASPSFVTLHPDAPAPDLIFDNTANFFDIDGDQIHYWNYPLLDWTRLFFGPGDLPTDGLHSMNRHWPNRALVSECMTPTNFAGDRLPPTDASELLVDKLSPDGTQLTLSWTDCLGSGDHHIIYGASSAIGTTLAPSGAKCDIRCSPYDWASGVPNPPSGQWVWFLVLSNDDDETEGSWGPGSGGSERIGPGPDGSSGMCSITAKNASNSCGP